VVTPTAGPRAIEPLSPERGDLRLMPLQGFGRFARDALRSWRHEANALYDSVHGVRDAARSLATTAPPQRKGLVPLGALIQGLPVADLEQEPSVLEREIEDRLQVTVSDADRPAVVEALRILREMLPVIRTMAAGPDTQLGELFERMVAPIADPARWPGYALSFAVAKVLDRDPCRGLLRSDLVDTDHALYFPYVDVLTCDRATAAAVRGALPGIRTPRRPRVLRTRKLESVIDVVRGLGRDGSPHG
jgi:hypothetical protein